jgi:chromosome segregation ATPase
MFFDKGKPESVSPDALEKLLNSLFDKSLAQFDDRMSELRDGTNRSISQFGHALESFERLNTEPDLDEMYGITVSHILIQKGLYTKALRHIIESVPLDDRTAPTVYERHRMNVTIAGEMMKEILQANFRFKQVLNAYANELKEFKSAYTAIEKHTGLMKDELERKEKDYVAYKRIKELILSLTAMIEDRSISMDSVAALKKELERQEGDAIGAAEEQIVASINKKAKMLSELYSKRAILTDKIVRMTRPLERAAKKLDHMSTSKFQLSPFLSDPYGTVATVSDYNEFTELLKQLETSLKDGKIDVKNANELAELARELLDIDLYSMISEFKEIKNSEASITEESEKLKAELSMIKEAGRSKGALISEIESMDKNIYNFDSEINAKCRMIEKEFEQQYNKRISILKF